jgi:amidase
LLQAADFGLQDAHRPAQGTRRVGGASGVHEELAATGRLSGPLHGIPVLVKDCIETADTPTTFGSIAIPRYLARADAEVVRRLRAAGAVVLGKTTLCDFAAGWFSYSSLTGDTKNPYEPGRDSGGSSAGSAAAVAANLDREGP